MEEEEEGMLLDKKKSVTKPVLSNHGHPTFSISEGPFRGLQFPSSVLPLVRPRLLDVIETLLFHGAQHTHTLCQHLLSHG